MPKLDLAEARRDLDRQRRGELSTTDWIASYGERLIAHLEASRIHRKSGARNLLRALGAVRVAYDAMVQLRTALAAYRGVTATAGRGGAGAEGRRILIGQKLADRVETIVTAFAVRSTEELTRAPGGPTPQGDACTTSPADGTLTTSEADLDRVRQRLDELDPEREEKN